MLIPQDSFGDGACGGVHLVSSDPADFAVGPKEALSPEQKVQLWDRIVRTHYLAEDLMHLDLAPHVGQQMTCFVVGVLKEWAVQAEEALQRGSAG